MQSADECQFFLTDLLMRTSVPFCHTFSGCDTTSAFFGKGKKQALNKLKNSKTFWDLVEIFSKPKAPIAAIERAGQAFAIARYDDHQNRCNTLDKLRVVKYTRKIATQPVTVSFQLSSLPPTSIACMVRFIPTS